MEMKISDIKIHPDRYRKDFGDIEALAESIKTYGVIQPLVLDQDGFLIAGERRLKASKMAGLETVPVVYKDGVDELLSKELELEENLHRKAFSWEEEVRAKKEIHELKQEREGKAVKGIADAGWGLKDTAQSLGEAIGTLAEDIQLAKALEIFPELSNSKNKSAAIKKLRQIRRRSKAQKEAEKIKSSGSLDGIYLGDSREILQTLESESVDLVIADPPFGIDYYDRVARAGHINEYEMDDDPQEILKMCAEVFFELFRVMKPNTHGYIFYGAQHYQWMYETLSKIGFDVDPVPWIWNKVDGGAPSSVQLKATHAYEPFLHISKGKRELQGPKPTNVLTYKRVPPSKRIHQCEKPLDLLQDLIEKSSNPGDVVLDPFGGSGSSGVSAIKLGRRPILIERSEATFTFMFNRIKEALEEEN